MVRLIRREVWKTIPSAPNYEASTWGRIKHKKNGIKKPTLMRNPRGKPYLIVSVVVDKKHMVKYVHRLVLETFVGPCPEGCTANHKDGFKENCFLYNLEYLTHLEQLDHAYDNGLIRISDLSLRVRKATQILAKELGIV